MSYYELTERPKEIEKRFLELEKECADVPQELIDEVYEDMQKEEIWDTCFSNKEFDCAVFERALEIHRRPKLEWKGQAA